MTDANKARAAARPESMTAITDEATFTEVAERHRRELHVHCYRMVGSFDDADDLVQDTLARAWRSRREFEGRASVRTWLYRIATNACLDFLERDRRRTDLSADVLMPRADGLTPPPHIPWLQPYPDQILAAAAPRGDEADAGLVARENIELGFLVATQLLPPKQRAALILCDVLDWSAQETAELLETTPGAVNAALQRARATLRRYRETQSAAGQPLDPEAGDHERRLVERYVDATVRCDIPAMTALLREDVRCTMPPDPVTLAGRAELAGAFAQGGFGTPPYDDWRCIVTRLNRMPAVACYLRQPGDDAYRAFTVDVLRVVAGDVAEISVFPLAQMVAALGLPAAIPAERRPDLIGQGE